MVVSGQKGSELANARLHQARHDKLFARGSSLSSEKALEPIPSELIPGTNIKDIQAHMKTFSCNRTDHIRDFSVQSSFGSKSFHSSPCKSTRKKATLLKKI